MNYYDMEQLSRIDPTYLAAFGLNSAPFSTRIDDRFYYQNNEITDHLQLLRHLIRFSNLLLMVIGEDGIGKTSLRQHLQSHADDNWLSCEIEAHTMMDSTLLLRDIIKGFAISNPPLDIPSLYKVLQQQLQHLTADNRIPLLIIDNAHELPQDSLEVLFNLSQFNNESTPLLRILLFCAPQIEAMLEAPAISMLRERITHRLHLSRFSEEETAEYLRHRMAVAGLDGASPFTPSAIKKIHRASAGNPASINEYAHQYLQDDREPPVDVDDDIPAPRSLNTMRIVAGSSILAIIIMGLLFQEQINQLFEDAPETPVSIEESPPMVPDTRQVEIVERTIEFDLNQPDKASEPTSPPAESHPDEPQPQAPGSSTEATAEALVSTPPANTDSTKPHTTEPLQADEPGTKTPLARLQLSAIDPAVLEGDNQSKTLTVKGEGFHDGQQILLTWTGRSKTLDPDQYSVDSDSLISININPGRESDTWTVTVHDPQTQQQSNTLSFEVRAVDTQQAFTPRDSRWIQQQNPGHFTLQLLGTYQQGSFEKYLRQHNLPGEAAWFTTQRNGRPWYTLIYGKYADRDSAKKAADSLPSTVGKPWLRSFASIQDLLKQSANLPKASPTILPRKAGIPSVDNLNTHTAWIWSQHPSHYTLQVMAGKNLQAIRSFWQTQKLAGKSVFYRTRKDNEDWYVLLYGEYASRQQALDAIRRLPTPLQNTRPWARPFSDIHRQLQASTSP